MQYSRARLALAIVIVLAVLLVVVLSVPRGGPPAPVPTFDVRAVQSQAVATFAAGLTATASANPTEQATNTPTAAQGSQTIEAGSHTPNCLGLRFVRDVTIPDNTDMTPAQVFTKTWLVTNTGTCPWQPGFQVVLIGGVAMGGSPFKVLQTVGPGGSIQISIKMATPTNQTGVVQGTWKMADADGKVFGDYLSVVVVVNGAGTTSAPPAASATPPTATP